MTIRTTIQGSQSPVYSEDVDATADFYGNAHSTRQACLVGIQVVAGTGSPAGNIILQGSLDYNPSTGDGTWVNLQTTAYATGAWGYTELFTPWVRIFWDFTGGSTGTFSLYLWGKQ